MRFPVRVLIPVASLLTAVALGAAGAQAPAAKSGKLPCPPEVPAGATERYARVFIDGRAVGGNLKVKLESGEPESYEILDPEPAELAKLPVAKIDLIRYDKGPEAEAKYGLCKGMVAVVITTKTR
jgi:hypothetical protein